MRYRLAHHLPLRWRSKTALMLNTQKGRARLVQLWQAKASSCCAMCCDCGFEMSAVVTWVLLERHCLERVVCAPMETGAGSIVREPTGPNKVQFSRNGASLGYWHGVADAQGTTEFILGSHDFPSSSRQWCLSCVNADVVRFREGNMRKCGPGRTRLATAPTPIRLKRGWQIMSDQGRRSSRERPRTRVMDLRAGSRRSRPRQNTRIAISAGSANNDSISSSSFTSVSEAPAMSSDVQ